MRSFRSKESSKKCFNQKCTHSGQECECWWQCAFFQAGGEENKKAVKTHETLRPTEDDEQIVVAEFCKYQHIPFVHIPNEGKRSAAYGVKLKEMGLQKGFPDIHIPQARGGYHAMYIELKRDSRSHPTKEQLEWVAYLNKNGYYAVVAYGADEAIAEIKKYFSERKENR